MTRKRRDPITAALGAGNVAGVWKWVRGRWMQVVSGPRDQLPEDDGQAQGARLLKIPPLPADDQPPVKQAA